METKDDHPEPTPPGDDNGQVTYIDFAPEQHALTTEVHHPIKNKTLSESQKRRRKLIPIRYHSRLFISSKKKRQYPGTHTTDHERCERKEARERCNTIATRSENRSSSMRESEKTKGFFKKNKYMWVVGVVLIFAVISGLVSYLANSSSSQDKLKSQVKEGVNELPDKQFMKQVVSNVTGVEYLAHVLSNISIKGVQDKMDVLSEELMDLPGVLGNLTRGDLNLQYMINELKVSVANHTNQVSRLVGNVLQKSDIPDREYVKQVVTNITKEEMKNTVDIFREEIPDREYIKQVVTNITKEEMKNTVELLRKDIPDKEYIELVIANITKEEVKTNMNIVKKDFYNLTEVIKKHLYKYINGTRCVVNCSGLTDGHYQSCRTCEGYISCVGGVPVERPCQPHHPNQTVYWDDFEKRCTFLSYTCDTKYLLVQ